MVPGKAGLKACFQDEKEDDKGDPGGVRDVPETPGEGHVDTFLPNGLRLMLDSEEVVKSFRPDWARTSGNQLSLALECASPAEVDEVYARVVAAGFEGEKEPWDAFWGQRYAQLADPDGVPVDLYAAL